MQGLFQSFTGLNIIGQDFEYLFVTLEGTFIITDSLKSVGIAIPAIGRIGICLRIELEQGDGIFVLTPMVPMVPELAREIERLRIEAGLSTKELLQGLCEQRERYKHANYTTD